MGGKKAAHDGRPARRAAVLPPSATRPSARRTKAAGEQAVAVRTPAEAAARSDDTFAPPKEAARHRAEQSLTIPPGPRASCRDRPQEVEARAVGHRQLRARRPQCALISDSRLIRVTRDTGRV